MATPTKEIIEFLLSQEMQLFDGLEEAQLTRIAKRLKEFKRANGQTLFSQGDDADNFCGTTAFEAPPARLSTARRRRQSLQREWVGPPA